MRKLFATVGAMTLLSLAMAWPSWPQAPRTTHIILTVPPGGTIDLLARLLADRITSTNKNQTFVIESRPGAGGIIAAEQVARSTPDGTTLLINNNGIIISSILRKVNYDAQASFEPICYLASSPQIIAVNSTSPYRTLSELLDAARAKPGELSIASVGPNTTQHLGIERFKRLAQANMTYVSFPGGAPTVNALLGGHVTAIVANWSEIGEQVLAGKARGLATMASKRIEPLPDMPTVAETGTKDFDVDVWFGIAAPAKTPKQTISRFIGWFRDAALAPDVKAKLTAQALYPDPRCGSDFAAHLARQAELYARVIKELGIKTE